MLKSCCTNWGSKGGGSHEQREKCNKRISKVSNGCVIKHRETDSLPYCLFLDNDGDKSVKNYYQKLKMRFENESETAEH